jgi:hypothetical protein
MGNLRFWIASASYILGGHTLFRALREHVHRRAPIHAPSRERSLPVNLSKPSLSVSEDMRIVHNDGSFLVSTWERHVISVWRREITGFAVATWGRYLADLLKQHPGQRLNVVGYLEPECLFDGSPGTFQACVELLRRFEGSVAAMTMIYNREGFWNAAMRGRLTAIFNESSSSVPYALHPTLNEALEWLAEHGASDIDAHPLALARQVEALRRA